MSAAIDVAIQERRTGARHLMSCPLPAAIRLAGGAGTASGLLLDASCHGLRLRSEAQLAVGAQVALLTVAGAVALDVAWRARAGAHAYVYGMSCRDAGADLAARLNALLA